MNLRETSVQKIIHLTAGVEAPLGSENSKGDMINFNRLKGSKDSFFV